MRGASCPSGLCSDNSTLTALGFGNGSPLNSNSPDGDSNWPVLVPCRLRGSVIEQRWDLNPRILQSGGKAGPPKEGEQSGQKPRHVYHPEVQLLPLENGNKNTALIGLFCKFIEQDNVCKILDTRPGTYVVSPQ